jgi:hypothetical protein
MKFIFLLTILLLLFTACNKKPGGSKIISEAELSASLKKDQLFNNYCAAMKELLYTSNRNESSKELNNYIRKAIKENEINSIEDLKIKYVANGGDPDFINTFDNFYFAQQKLSEKYKETIKNNRKVFQKVVARYCSPI